MKIWRLSKKFKDGRGLSMVKIKLWTKKTYRNEFVTHGNNQFDWGARRSTEIFKIKHI